MGITSTTRPWMVLTALSLLMVSTANAANARGYLGRQVSGEDVAKHKRQLAQSRRKHGLESTQHRRVLPYQRNRHHGGDAKKERRAVKSSVYGKKRTSTRTAIRGRGGMHDQPTFYDDDDYVVDDGYGRDDYVHSDAHDDYIQDDYVYIPVRGKGVMMGKMGKGDKKPRMKRGSSYYDDNTRKNDDFYPKAGTIPFLDDGYFDDKFFKNDECELVSFNETFSVPSASLFLAPDTSITNPGTPALPGTLFIFEREYILEADGTPINGTTVSGTCTRTESSGSGAGICNFVFIDDEGYSLHANGLLSGPHGSEISMTGGTGAMLGVMGEMDVVPVFEYGANNSDIFLDPIQYDFWAYVGLVVCP